MRRRSRSKDAGLSLFSDGSRHTLVTGNPISRGVNPSITIDAVVNTEKNITARLIQRNRRSGFANLISTEIQSISASFFHGNLGRQIVSKEGGRGERERGTFYVNGIL